MGKWQAHQQAEPWGWPARQRPPWCAPAHLRGGVEKLHFVAAVADEQEELLGERRVPDHAGGVAPLVCPVDVQDYQVVFVALHEIVLYLRRSTGVHEDPAQWSSSS